MAQKIRLSDYIADYLEKEQGCKRVFLLSGGGMMHLLDAVSRKSELKYICNHHEQACAMAAESYARKTGKLGVCYATSGPGGTNTITGVVGAWQDSSPVLFISGQSKLSQTIQHTQMYGLRQFGTFEVDIIPIVKSITKYAVFIDDPKMIRYHLEKACTLALSGRPGPVFLDIPVDIQGALIEPDKLKKYDPALEQEPAPPVPNDATLDAILDQILQAKRPLILAGHGVRCSNAVKEFNDLVHQLNVPVITTQLAVDLMLYEDPLFVGHPGMKGDRAGNFAVQTADLVLVIGSSLHVMTTGYELDQFAPHATKILVDPDPAVLKRQQVEVHQKIHASVDVFVKHLRNRLNHRAKKTFLIESNLWHERCLQWKSELSIQNEPHNTENGTQINYYDFIDALSDACKGGETVVADAGSAFYMIGQAFRVKENQRVIISGALGTMGFTLPAATGASAADPEGLVIGVTGDGSLQTNIHEFATIRHNNLNIKTFVINNDGYVSIRNTQNNFFKGHLAGSSQESGVSFPNLEKLADAYGLPYFSTKDRSDLRSTVEKAIQHKGPVICEIFTVANQEILPTVSSERLEDGSMRSKPIHDMYPFMDPDRLKRYSTF